MPSAAMLEAYASRTLKDQYRNATSVPRCWAATAHRSNAELAQDSSLYDAIEDQHLVFHMLDYQVYRNAVSVGGPL